MLQPVAREPIQLFFMIVSPSFAIFLFILHQMLIQSYA